MPDYLQLSGAQAFLLVLNQKTPILRLLITRHFY